VSHSIRSCVGLVLIAFISGCAGTTTSPSIFASDDVEIDGVNPATIESVDKTEKFAAAIRGLVFENGRVRVDPQYAPPRNDQMSENRVILGREAIDLNQRDAAIIHMAAAIRLNPDNADAYFGLGRAVTLRGKTAEAAASFRTALELRPGWTDAQFELGMSLWRAGQLEDATTEFRAIVANDPNHGPSLERLAVAAYYAGDRAAAAQYARASEAAGHPVPSQLWELLRN
jgi:tetratricopeptide (TPR) repeat protein